jgi:hypothetical protein
MMIGTKKQLMKEEKRFQNLFLKDGVYKTFDPIPISRIYNP